MNNNSKDNPKLRNPQDVNLLLLQSTFQLRHFPILTILLNNSSFSFTWISPEPMYIMMLNVKNMIRLVLAIINAVVPVALMIKRRPFADKRYLKNAQQWQRVNVSNTTEYINRVLEYLKPVCGGLEILTGVAPVKRMRKNNSFGKRYISRIEIFILTEFHHQHYLIELSWSITSQMKESNNLSKIPKLISYSF